MFFSIPDLQGSLILRHFDFRQLKISVLLASKFVCLVSFRNCIDSQ